MYPANISAVFRRHDRYLSCDDFERLAVANARRGLDAALCSALASEPPERLIYLSCGIDSLARDVALLTASGALRVAGLEAFSFFPFTEHVETLVWLDRAKA